MSDTNLHLLHHTTVALVRSDRPDLTARQLTARQLAARQLAVFLTVYLTDEAQTVRGLAVALGVQKPAVTRALDRLGEFELVKRKVDQADRRSVLVQRTAAGRTFLRELGGIMGGDTVGRPVRRGADAGAAA
jgi:DNA-binding MarR family transcriptional regulator